MKWDKLKTYIRKKPNYDQMIEVPFNSQTEQVVFLMKKGTPKQFYTYLGKQLQAQIHNSILLVPEELVSKVIKIKKEVLSDE